LHDENKTGWFLFFGILSLIALGALAWDWHNQSVKEAVEDADKPWWERRHPKPL
jgi:hypothetical protein